MRQLKHLHMTSGLMFLAIASTMAEPMRGHNMKPAKFPFVASITEKGNSQVGGREHYASGALIAEDLVLTAAHCVESYKFEQVDVVFGAADLKFAKPRYEVHSWIAFGQWARNREWDGERGLTGLEPNDIAIIKLKRRVTGVTPANITSLKVDDLYGKNVTLVGWAAGKDGQGRFMKKAKVRILTNTECDQRGQLLSNAIEWVVPGGLICTAADPFTLMTLGDSGAPLLDGNNVILAVNRGVCTGKFNCSEELADEHRFNLHTYFLDKYRRFIDEMKADWLYIPRN